MPKLSNVSVLLCNWTICAHLDQCLTCELEVNTWYGVEARHDSPFTKHYLSFIYAVLHFSLDFRHMWGWYKIIDPWMHMCLQNLKMAFYCKFKSHPLFKKYLKVADLPGQFRTHLMKKYLHSRALIFWNKWDTLITLSNNFHWAVIWAVCEFDWNIQHVTVKYAAK